MDELVGKRIKIVLQKRDRLFASLEWKQLKKQFEKHRK